MAAPFAPDPEPGERRGRPGVVGGADRPLGPASGRARHGAVRVLRRVSTEDWQDPVTSRARQREQAEALVRGHGQIVADFFDVGQTRKPAWACRPQSATLVAQLADPDRGWDASVIGEYERAFYGSRYAAMAPLFEHYGVQLWMPEADGRVDYASEHDEKTMTALGLSSKREITRPTRPGTRTAQRRVGRSARSPRSWRTPGIQADRCGTGSVPTPSWSTRPM
jgi:site-specific DNA recombinase